MINENMFKQSENISSLYNAKQVLGPRGKGIVRAKGNALGDVRNTLHSRPASNTNPCKTPSVVGKSGQNENAFSVRKTYSTDKAKQVKSESCSAKKQLSPSKLTGQEYHNHNLCERANDVFFNTFLNDFKMSEDNVKSLARGFKTKFVIPVSRKNPPLSLICEDIEVFDENKIWEDKSSPLNDSFDDIKLPDISPPEEH